MKVIESKLTSEKFEYGEECWIYEATICTRPVVAMWRLIAEYQTLCTPLPMKGVVHDIHGMRRRFVIWAPAAHEIVGFEMVTFVGCFAFAWI